MDNSVITELQKGLSAAFIDSACNSSLALKPEFVSNDYKAGKKVLSSIEDELMRCDKFQISVAFITMSGITPLLLILKELEARGVPGEILTTNYLNFSEPAALRKLNELSNITVKMYDVESSHEGFHTKGYIFRKEELYRIIIGSSNITSSALTSNREWNTKIISTDKGEVCKQILAEFEELWNSEYALPYEVFYEEYKLKFDIIKKQRETAVAENPVSLVKYNLKPNVMQVRFINNLEKIIESGKDRALLISATGTGKTYASAFAMRQLEFKRVLFLVHRNQLAKQTKYSYERVFDRRISMGLVGAGHSEYDKDFVFATVQTLSKDENIKRLEPDRFDCIILDEAHHGTADTYRKIMNYFKPRFWLGMTATPDKRNDNIVDNNVYELFDYQIAYEIRLQQAMEENLLCPFHYFGITDLNVVSCDNSGADKAVVSDNTDNTASVDRTKAIDFNMLVSDERVKHIISQAEYYGYSGSRVKGLVFCSSIRESDELSEQFNRAGYRTISLNGSASEDEREEAFERLAMDETPGSPVIPLDYIFSVEILNEGVDIVEVNQVIMLRPTESPIVFVQQLGRGLRKAPGKEYVVILDFIANYSNNFMIPIALSGDRTYNKDNLRHVVGTGSRTIPGASTVHFDEISRKRIFESVDKANFSDIKLIKDNYITLKNKIGHIPSLSDFDTYGEMDVLRIFDNANLGSYYKFLVKYEKDYCIRLSPVEEKIIEYVSKKLASGKRVHELLLIKQLISDSKLARSNTAVIRTLETALKSSYNLSMSAVQKTNVANVLTNDFLVSAQKKTYSDCIFIERNSAGNDYSVARSFFSLLENKVFNNMLEELVDFGISRYERDYSAHYKNTDFVLYKKYTYEDVCRLLNWENNEVPTNIGGYKYNDKTKTYPIFINYEKDDAISDTTKYEDRFIDNRTLIAISKSRRKIESADVQNMLKAKERGITVELFVRKNKDDKISKEFYYLGHMCATGNANEFTMSNTDASAVEIEWRLDEPIREDIYDYIVNG